MAISSNYILFLSLFTEMLQMANNLFLFLRTQQAKCLNDDEPKSKFEMPKGLPGKIYDGDAQCVRMFGAGAKVCDIPDLKAVTIKFALNSLFLVLNRIFS